MLIESKSRLIWIENLLFLYSIIFNWKPNTELNSVSKCLNTENKLFAYDLIYESVYFLIRISNYAIRFSKSNLRILI
jgi:hypothetical protein